MPLSEQACQPPLTQTLATVFGVARCGGFIWGRWGIYPLRGVLIRVLDSQKIEGGGGCFESQAGGVPLFGRPARQIPGSHWLSNAWVRQ